MPDLDPEDRHFELCELLLKTLRNYMGKHGRHWSTDELVLMQRILNELTSGHLDYQPRYNSSSRPGYEDPERRQILASRALRVASSYQQQVIASQLTELQQLIYDLVATHAGISPAWLRASADIIDINEGRLLLSQVDG